jgi:asparagine synthase (glutamine-hydrolysing)
MCGIVGGFGREVKPSRIENSVLKLYHRGPDHQGFISLPGNCYMGVARLAMTDPLPRSNQPLSIENQKFTISFNGEIYNFKEIKKDLIRDGVNFETESDTEVLATLLANKGISGIAQLEGMFAFAFYDAKAKKLLVARDRLGKKPLYYYKSNENFYWSSSLDILVELSGSNPVETGNDHDYLSIGYHLDPRTGYKDIYSLVPGHYIEINCDNQFSEVKKIPKREDKNQSENSLRDALWKAIEVRTEGHKNIAISLSGGVDSSIIALGLKQLGVETTAFSAYWSNSDKERYNSDKDHAREIARTLGHRFIEVDISKGFNLENILQKYLIAMEEPNNNPSGLSTLALYEAISDHGIKLLLTGDGSDEIFGGYRRHKVVSQVPRIAPIRGNGIQRHLFARNNRLQRTIANLLASQLDPEDPLRWLHWHWVFTPKELQNLLSPSTSMQQITKEISDLVEGLSPMELTTGATQSLMRRDHEIWLSMESNRKLDRISMAFSIEARSPFQDENVIEIANRLMSQTKFTKLDKVSLKEAFPEIKTLQIKNEKVGFTSPLGHWMREEPQFIRESVKFLQSQTGWNRTALEFFLDAQFKNDYKTNMQLWTLVVYANWLKMKKS